jgi:hypothetical protein
LNLGKFEAVTKKVLSLSCEKKFNALQEIDDEIKNVFGFDDIHVSGYLSGVWGREWRFDQTT